MKVLVDDSQKDQGRQTDNGWSTGETLTRKSKAVSEAPCPKYERDVSLVWSSSDNFRWALDLEDVCLETGAYDVPIGRNSISEVTQHTLN